MLPPWTRVHCPDCGNPLPPRGRSLPLEMIPPDCCERYRSDPNVNTRTLWDEHDSTRHYTDPDGWAEHERTCAQCGAVGGREPS